MNQHKVKEVFFDQFETILDILSVIFEDKRLLLDENDTVFHEEIDHQALDEFTRSVCITFSSMLGLPYDEVFDTLEDKLAELYYAFE